MINFKFSFIKDFLLWLYWYPFRILIQRTPAGLAYKLARLGGILLFHISVRKRRTFETEYRHIFIDSAGLTPMNLAVKKAFINLCQAEIEMMCYSKMNAQNIHQFVTSPSFRNLDTAIEAGKGVMLLFAHFGANQMVMPAVGYNGYKMSQMSAPATVWVEKLPDRRFSVMEKRALGLRWKQELSLPVTHINIFGSLRRAIICLKNNGILGVAIDGGGGKERTETRLMNKPALFSTGAATLAVRMGCAVLPTFMIRTEDGPNRMIILPSVSPSDSTSQEAAIREIIQAFADQLTYFIHEYPDHYLNFMALRSFMSQFGDIPLFLKKEQPNEFDHSDNSHTA
jgi:KDO2-lipid IV(A) lauroyltransferase